MKWNEISQHWNFAPSGKWTLPAARIVSSCGRSRAAALRPPQSRLSAAAVASGTPIERAPSSGVAPHAGGTAPAPARTRRRTRGTWTSAAVAAAATPTGAGPRRSLQRKWAPGEGVGWTRKVQKKFFLLYITNTIKPSIYSTFPKQL